LREGWLVAAIITFYGNALEHNEIADANDRGLPVVETSETIAARFRMMSANLAEALDELNHNRPFPLTHDLRALFGPTGNRLSDERPPLKNQQDVLRALAGRPLTPGRYR
jgi:hypothetical protein